MLYHLYNTLRTIIKHFEASIKNKEILNQALENLQLSQVHLISWCQTRMGHFHKACSVANDKLSAIYDVMATCNIHQDKMNSLFTVQSIYLLKLMTCLEKPFMGAYLRPSDKSDLLVSAVFNISEKLVILVIYFNTLNFKDFIQAEVYLGCLCSLR